MHPHPPPVEVPVELLVFLCRIWIVRISECTDSNKDDPHAVNLWTKPIVAVGKLLDGEEERRGCPDLRRRPDDALRLPLAHAETRLTQIKRFFLTVEHAPNDSTPFHHIVLATTALMAAYIVTHIDEVVPDLLEDVRHVLFALAIATKASTDVALQFFLRADNRIVTELRAEGAAATPAVLFLHSSKPSTRMVILTTLRTSGTASPTAPRPPRSLRN